VQNPPRGDLTPAGIRELFPCVQKCAKDQRDLGRETKSPILVSCVGFGCDRVLGSG